MNNKSALNENLHKKSCITASSILNRPDQSNLKGNQTDTIPKVIKIKENTPIKGTHVGTLPEAYGFSQDL